MLDKLRKRASILLEESKNSSSYEKYVLINNILKNDNCFMEMDSIDAISILIDLNIKQEDIKKVYISLMDKEGNEH